jgi:hypothetical protein
MTARGLLLVSRIDEFTAWMVRTKGWRHTPERAQIRQHNPFEADALRDLDRRLHLIYVKYFTRNKGRAVKHASVPTALIPYVRQFLRETACATPPTSSATSTLPSPAAPH